VWFPLPTFFSNSLNILLIWLVDSGNLKRGKEKGDKGDKGDKGERS